MVDESIPEMKSPAPRVRRRTLRGTILRWSARTALAALTLGVLWLAYEIASRENRRRERPPVSSAPGLSEAIPTRVVTKEERATQNNIRSGATVSIQAPGPNGTQTRGSGFFLGSTGLVVTNFHVAAACTEAEIRTSEGIAYSVAGYAAVSPRHDLALLAITGSPKIAGYEMPQAEKNASREVWSIGHPLGIEFSISEGEVSRAVRSSELPAASQRFLKELIPGGGDLQWLQHTAAIAPGNSGGPLLNAEGCLLGVNTWVDQRTRFGYALSAEYLAELVKEATERPLPLSRFANAEARAEAELWKLSAQRLTDLFDQCRALNWQAVDESDYETLQRFAWAITTAQMPDTLQVRGVLGDRLNTLAAAADRAAARLRSEKWDEPAAITLINERAERELLRPGAGQFFFATIDRLVEGPDGSRGLIGRLAGFDTPVFLPLEQDQLTSFAPGTQCLILGVNFRGRTMRWGENPLDPVIAPVILSRLMIPLEAK